MPRMKILSFWRQSWKEPFNTKYYVTVAVVVPAPTFEHPVACVMVSIRNSHARVMWQLRSMAEVQRVLVVPEDAVERLEGALVTANRMAVEINQRYQAMQAAANPPEPVMGDADALVEEAEGLVRKKKR